MSTEHGTAQRISSRRVTMIRYVRRSVFLLVSRCLEILTELGLGLLPILLSFRFGRKQSGKSRNSVLD